MSTITAYIVNVEGNKYGLLHWPMKVEGSFVLDHLVELLNGDGDPESDTLDCVAIPSDGLAVPCFLKFREVEFRTGNGRDSKIGYEILEWGQVGQMEAATGTAKAPGLTKN